VLVPVQRLAAAVDGRLLLLSRNRRWSL